MTVDTSGGSTTVATRLAPGMERRDRRSVVVFLACAFTLAWLVALPLWLGNGLASPWFPLVAVAMMTTPAIAALVVVFVVERPQHKARTLGLWPLTPARRVFGYAALGIVVPIALVLVALPVGALLGVYPADFGNLSAFRQLLEARAAGADELPISPGALVVLQLATLPVAAFVNLLPALGEELGWRGWLLPKFAATRRTPGHPDLRRDSGAPGTLRSSSSGTTTRTRRAGSA